jgi:hypothetical protein
LRRQAPSLGIGGGLALRLVACDRIDAVPV